MEIWKYINGYEGLYEISNKGRVRNAEGRILKARTQNKGYFYVTLHSNHKERKFTIHRLVAEAFIPKINGFNQVNHINGNKKDNSVENLEWCNQRLNYNHGMQKFLYSHNENHYFAKLTNEQVKTIPTLFKIGFTRTTISRILNVDSSSIKAIEKGISYRELGLDFSNIKIIKYKDLPNIKIPIDVWNIFKDNTVLNTLISQGKVSV